MMNFWFNTYLRLVRCFNKKNLLKFSNSYFLYSSYNIQTMLTNGSALTGPKETNTLKRPTKYHKQMEYNQETEFKHNNEYTQNIDSRAYFLLSVPVICFGLGIWQIERRTWKLNLIRDLEDKLSKSPIPIPKNLNDLAQLNYYPIKLKGEFIYDNEFVIGPRSLIINGKAASEGNKNMLHRDFNKGYNVITPFKVKDRDLIVLVNRGWLPNKYKNANERKNCRVEGTVEIIGLNRVNEARPQFVFKNIPEQGVWNYRDISEMAKFANTAPVFIDMIESDHKPGMPVGSQTRVNLRNEHLNYIITWFGLSIFSGYYWFKIFIQRRFVF